MGRLSMRGSKIRMLLIAASAALGACSSICGGIPAPIAHAHEVQAGEYRLVIWATEGSKPSASTVGRLWLLEAPSEHWGHTRLYGHADVDFKAVGAPMLAELGPRSDSQDPNAPGVLLQRANFDPGYPDDAPVLLIGTLSNSNPIHVDADGKQFETISLDGAGIGMWVHKVTKSGFVGRWSEWGLLVDGSGVFCAKRVR